LTRMILYPVVGLSRLFLRDPKTAVFLAVGSVLLFGFILIGIKKDS
jgi:hypothetical protein